MENIRERFKVGFIFYYPILHNSKTKIRFDQKTTFQLNNLLARLNRKYPDLFPHCHYSSYKIISVYNKVHKHPKQILFNDIYESDNLLRIKEELEGIDTIICLGEKGYVAIQKVLNLYPLNINVIKTKALSYPVSRHIKLNNQGNPSRVRTNFNILSLYNDIDKKISSLLI